MIKVIDGEKKHKYTIEEYDRLVSKAKEVSDKTLLHFFDVIGIDRDLLEHLTDVNLVLNLDESYNYERMLAFYENTNDEDHDLDNSINFLPEYLDSIIDKNNKTLYDDLVKTILHETIHANRSIIINNAVLFPECMIYSVSRYEYYRKKYSSVIKPSDKDYQVVELYKDECTKAIYVYDNVLGDFLTFTYPDEYDFNSIEEADEFFNNDSSIFFHVATIENPYSIEYSSLVSNYSTLYKNPLYITKNDNNRISHEVNKQCDFEECITESFAIIMFYLKDKDEFNIDELIQNKKLMPNVRLALTFINNLDMDTIKWYFLSCYQEEYNNKFFELYGKDYYRLIDELSTAYEKVLDGEEYTGYDKCLTLINKIKK